MRQLSIAVAGAGPAGLTAALLLARDGHRVTVFDQFETPRPLGSGLILQPTGLAVLGGLGLGGRIAEQGARIDRMFGRALPSGRVVLDVSYAPLGGGLAGLAVHRAALFGVLFDAVGAASIPVATGHRITAVRQESRGAFLVAERGRDGPFDLVVDALGVRSALAPAFGEGRRGELAYGALWTSVPRAAAFDPNALEQRYVGAHTMIGVLPTGRRDDAHEDEVAFFWSIRLDGVEAWRRAGLDAWKDEVAGLWPDTAPLLTPIVDAGQMTLARYAHAMLARPVANRLAAIGDSFHATSPQLGQGANMAMLDAWELAAALRRESDIGEALATYATVRRRQMWLYQRISAIFTPFYQSDSRILPVLRDWLLAPATRLPVVRGFVAAVLAGIVLSGQINARRPGESA